MGGTNVPPLFDVWENVYLYVHCYRGGTYERIYGSATNEAVSSIQATDDSGIPQSLWLCQALRLKQLYLHATYGDAVAVPRNESLASRLPEPVYTSLGVGTGSSAVEQRLMRTKTLLTKRDAEVELERKDRFNLVLFGGTPKSYADLLSKIDRRDRAKSYNGALATNTAFMNLISRQAVSEDMDDLLYEGFRVLQVCARNFAMSHAKFIANGCRGNVYNLSDLSQSENMYFREEISCEESLKIPGIPLIQRKRDGSSTLRLTSTKVGLYEISESQELWAQRLSDELKELRASHGVIPKELVRDILGIANG
jgi:hypothetical protein